MVTATRWYNSGNSGLMADCRWDTLENNGLCDASANAASTIFPITDQSEASNSEGFISSREVPLHVCRPKAESVEQQIKVVLPLVQLSKRWSIGPASLEHRRCLSDNYSSNLDLYINFAMVNSCKCNTITKRAYAAELTLQTIGQAGEYHQI